VLAGRTELGWLDEALCVAPLEFLDAGRFRLRPVRIPKLIEPGAHSPEN
jgi:hypothetical protein